MAKFAVVVTGVFFIAIIVVVRGIVVAALERRAWSNRNV